MEDKTSLRGRVLVIAGSDCSGGAGIQADIKTITCLGGYAMTAITALTVQNTQGVQDVLPVQADTVLKQVTACIDDIGVDAVKIGMLHSAALVEAVAGILAPLAAQCPIVVDPVMVAKGGSRLLEDSAVMALRTRLSSLAAVLTPNIPEAAVLLDCREQDIEADMASAARHLCDQTGSHAVYLKGGHGSSDVLTDYLATSDSVMQTFTTQRRQTRHTHGTGCTLASALAAGLAQNMSLEDSAERAFFYVQQALAHAPAYGHGHGPLGHMVFAQEA